jgi:hypothetical protein
LRIAVGNFDDGLCNEELLFTGKRVVLTTGGAISVSFKASYRKKKFFELLSWKIVMKCLKKMSTFYAALYAFEN